MLHLHETLMGRKFFEGDFPHMIRSMDSLKKELSAFSDLKKEELRLRKQELVLKEQELSLKERFGQLKLNEREEK